MFIDQQYIEGLLKDSTKATSAELNAILDKAEAFKGLTHAEVAALLSNDDEQIINRMFKIALKIKEHIYGNRIVLFAPLYISDYCVNKCTYCNYNHDHSFPRTRLTQQQVRDEVKVLESMGHKRLALEAGEDPVNCPIDYVIECINTIYDMKFKHGEIRRVNVNIAATTVEDYKKLKDVGIGTYILFQESYHRPTYESVHTAGPKSSYEYHLTAFDRAMEAGIDDVGAGVLFGLYDWRFEVLAMMLHNEHLENKFGVGFHTISVPRIRRAPGAQLHEFPYLPTDDEFKKIVAILRLAVPFTGMIISTRETSEMRRDLINLGISQVSGGSAVGVGGYSAKSGDKVPQFVLEDDRPTEDVIKWLMDEGLIPSFCTACYRMGRTGDRFMSLAKSGNIKYVCHPNALSTLWEYALDYGDEDTREKARQIIETESKKIDNEKIRNILSDNIEKLNGGQRDLYL